MRQRKNSKAEFIAYIIGWCLAAAVLALHIAMVYGKVEIWKILPPCMFHRLTGYYCPGCGGTRAVIAFLHGDFLESFRCHPVVLYAAVLGAWFLVSQTIEKISRHRIRIGMQLREIYLWIALAILILNVLVKNIALGVFHIDLLAGI